MGRLIQTLIDCTRQQFFCDVYIIKCFMGCQDAIIYESNSDLLIKRSITMGQDQMSCCLVCIDFFASPFQGVGHLRRVSPRIIDLIMVYVFSCLCQPARCCPKFGIGQALAGGSVEARFRLLWRWWGRLLWRIAWPWRFRLLWRWWGRLLWGAWPWRLRLIGCGRSTTAAATAATGSQQDEGQCQQGRVREGLDFSCHQDPAPRCGGGGVLRIVAT